MDKLVLNRMIRHLIFLLGWGFSIIVYSQNNQYRFDHITVEDGLSKNYTTCVFQDSYGYIWIGTTEGLCLYDGYSVKVYTFDPKDSSSISSNYIRTIIEDSQKRIWIGTQFGGLNFYNREKDIFTSFKFQDGEKYTPETDVINAITEIEDGKLALGSNNGLFIFDTKKVSYEHYMHSPHTSNTLCGNSVSSLLFDGDNNLWIGSLDNDGLCLLKLKEKTFQTYPNPAVENAKAIYGINNICKDNADKIWIASKENGLAIFNTKTEKYESFSVSNKIDLSGLNRIWYISKDSRSNMWIGSTNNGIFKLNTESGYIENILPNEANKDGLSSPSITCCMEDKDGNMWFCSNGGGINYISNLKNKFEYYTHSGNKESLSNNFVSCFYEDINGSIWIGTDGGALNKFNPTDNTFEKYNYTRGFRSNIITDIEKGPGNSLWLATLDEGLFLFNTETGIFKQFYNPKSTNSLSFKKVKDLEIINGKIHIATQGDGLNIFDYENNIFYHHENSPEMALQLYAPLFGNIVFHDSKNRIWIGTSRGLFIFSKNELNTYFYTPGDTTAISSNNIITIFEDSNRQLWFGTKNGLNLYNEAADNFTNMNEIAQLPAIIKAILEDKKGNLWISSNSGITKLNPVSLQTTHFSMKDGLQGNEFYDRSCLLSKSGKMYFGGVNGFSAFYPDSITVKNKEIAPYFTELRIFNQVVRPNDESGILDKHIMFCDEITLSHNRATFSVYFSSVDISQSHRINYAYKMENLDDKWTYVDDEKKAHFTSLKPGVYYLKVKAGTGDINAVSAERRLKITIEPPFWNTLWFKIIVFISLSLFIFSIFQRRIRKIEKQRKTLARQVKERTRKIEVQKDKLAEQAEQLQEQNLTLREQKEELSGTYSELKMQSDELKSANSELRKINETKNKLFSLIAHDLKGPIASIEAFSDILSSDFEDLNISEVKSYIDIIRNSSHVGVEIFENLLEWARSQTEMVQFKQEAVNLREIIDKVTELQSLTASNKNVQVVNKIKKNLWFLADKNMLQSIFRNLLSNAIKFTIEGGAVILKAEILDDQVIVSFKDSGVGMTKEKTEALLDSEDMMSTAGTSGEKGVGLGITICKEFINKHAGKMLIESEYGKGTTVVVILPNKKVSKDEIIKNITSGGAQERKNVSDKNYLPILKEKLILIIDDDSNSRQTVKYNLKNKCEIIEAKDGRQGIELAKQKMPDLIITDLVMPTTDGIELCIELKKDKHTNFIPIIILTANDTENQKVKAFTAGADEFIAKPFNPEILESRIINLLQKQEKIKIAIRDNFSFETEDSRKDPNAQFVKKIQEFTDKHINDSDFNVEFLASQLGYSRYQFFRKFKAILGQTPIEYILNYRLSKAEFLLKQGELRVSEVAYETGFSNPKYFATTFRKKYGMSPSEYIQKKQESRLL